MTNGNHIEELVKQIDSLVETATSESSLDASEVRRILKFISQVVQIVEQAFQDVLTLQMDIKYLQPEELHSHKLVELRKNAELLTARSYYRDAAEICSRLKHLRENFDEYIRSSVESLPGFSDWHGVFGLIEHREGRIIMLIDRTAYEINGMLDRAEKGELELVKKEASDRAEELRTNLKVLHDLNGKILGLSGGVGFLELTSNRNELQREVRIMIDKRDQSITHGHRVSTGAGSTFQGNLVVATTIQDSFKTVAESKADQDLKEELDRLCSQVSEMLSLLPDDQKENAAQDLNGFVTEVTKEKPRKKWYELSAEGLIEAAKACAGVTSPVISTVKKILALIV